MSNRESVLMRSWRGSSDPPVRRTTRKVALTESHQVSSIADRSLLELEARRR